MLQTEHLLRAIVAVVYATNFAEQKLNFITLSKKLLVERTHLKTVFRSALIVMLTWGEQIQSIQKADDIHQKNCKAIEIIGIVKLRTPFLIVKIMFMLLIKSYFK